MRKSLTHYGGEVSRLLNRTVMIYILIVLGAKQRWSGEIIACKEMINIKQFISPRQILSMINRDFLRIRYLISEEIYWWPTEMER